MTLFFGAIAFAGIALPLGAVSVQPDAVRPLIPSGAALAIGGTAAVVLIARRRPLAAAVSVSLMMLLLTGTLTLWFFPYLERFKSHRLFAQVINATVPIGTPLYIYADNMHHFNFYTRRSTIPVLETAADVAALRDRREKSYVLIKERHLEKLPVIPPERIAASNSPDADWHLLEFEGQGNRK
jgi:hypothetical protein